MTAITPEYQPTASKPILKHEGDHALVAAEDILIEEVPVALTYNGISHAVLLASPCDLAYFALGFSLSEGILSHAAQLYDTEVIHTSAGIEVRLEIATERFVGLKERRRTLAGRTGCGLCGVENLSAVSRTLRPIQRGPAIPLAALPKALEAFPQAQPLRALSGAIHGAAWVSRDGDIIKVFEDVGRHNALDKLVGWLSKTEQDVQQGFALVSSRASYEMVQKSATIGIGCLVAVSAPTAFAVDLAEQVGMTLVGFARPHKQNIYTHPQGLIA
ncbi:MAG: formate dehydrogenase accessory sulfurtransferase FdhD [Neisseriaceae bacterium]|nr:formate dehydrogenase accessory sulfurtransferase FdhD [Neisseriaceae bacterium]MBP6863617.1 formate dehydrogenase accessory sulfurtransferase FdhD [Neisseriaceae bacterium]